MSTEPDWADRAAREFRATTVGLSNESTDRLAAIIRKRAPACSAAGAEIAKATPPALPSSGLGESEADITAMLAGLDKGQLRWTPPLIAKLIRSMKYAPTPANPVPTGATVLEEEIKFLNSYVIPEKDKYGRYWHDLAQERLVTLSAAESELTALRRENAELRLNKPDTEYYDEMEARGKILAEKCREISTLEEEKGDLLFQNRKLRIAAIAATNRPNNP